MIEKKKILTHFGLLIFLVVADNGLKYFSYQWSAAHINPGFFLGVFHQSSAIIRIAALSSLAGFLFFIYAVLIIFLHRRIPWIKEGLTLLIAGILSNVFDRILRGHTTDWIPFEFKSILFYFNIADICIALGASIVVICLFRYEKLIWKSTNVRQSYLINPHEQIKFASKMLLVSLSTGFLMVLFCLGFWQSVLPPHSDYIRDNMGLFIVFYVFIMLTFSVIVFIVSLVLAHRTAGPMYALENHIKKLLAGQRTTLHLRRGDNYQQIEQLAKELKIFFESADKKIDQSDHPNRE